jgi:pyruvate dehydrogenase E2 component (dihydrolipoamide acetyltransferase)
MKTGKIARWHASEGDSVKAGQPLLEVETDKITNTVEAPGDGVLFQIVVPAGNVVPVMTIIGVIAAPGETPERIADAAVAAPAAASAQGAPDSSTASASASKGETNVRAMPAARRVAKELGIPLAGIQGSGPDGIVTEKDVRAAHETGKTGPQAAAADAGQGKADPDETVIPLEGVRQIIAVNMQASLQSAAQLTVLVEADVTEMVSLRQSMLDRNRKNPDYRLSYNDIIAYAVCRALLRHPVMNSTLQDDGIHLHKHVNLGIAVSLKNGLIVPNVKKADTHTLETLKDKIRNVSARARSGGMDMDEISGGTFTISNVSMMGVDGFTPILNPPETGILGVGRVIAKPAVYNGEIGIRQMMTLSLTFNHMTTDGGPAMAFLRDLADMLENPVRMLG